MCLCVVCGKKKVRWANEEFEEMGLSHIVQGYYCTCLVIPVAAAVQPFCQLHFEMGRHKLSSCGLAKSKLWFSVAVGC